MNLHPMAIAALSLSLLTSVPCQALTIVQVDYAYPRDGMARPGVHGRMFVIGEDAGTGPHLIPALKAPPLALRVSRDVDAVPETTHKKPEYTPKDTSKKDAPKVQSIPEVRATVLFPLDSAILGDDERMKLSSFIEKIGEKTTGNEVSVTGYTCDLGGKEHNDILAKKRAEAVASYLRAIGVVPSRVSGEGKCCYRTEETGKWYLNRRVEIRLDNKEATP